MKTCKVCGSDKGGVKDGLCCRHYTQMARYGKILTRTRFEKNEIIEDGLVCRMFLYDKNGNCTSEVIFDKVFKDKVSQFKWHNDKGYAVTLINRHSFYLHWLVLGRKKGFVTDHINRDKSDNRKKNLRFLTIAQNQWNREVAGVRYDDTRGKWVAKIVCNKKVISLGRFKTLLEAQNARRKAERQYFGEFSPNYNRAA